MDCDSASVLIFGALGWPYRHPRPPTGPRRSVLVARAPRSPDDPRAVCLPNLSASSGTPGRAVSIFRSATLRSRTSDAGRSIIACTCVHKLEVLGTSEARTRKTASERVFS